MTSLMRQMLVMPGCVRTSYAVIRTLINLTFAGDKELASFVAHCHARRRTLFSTHHDSRLLPPLDGARRPSPAAHTASLVFLMVALYFRVPLAVAEEAWANARIDERAFRPCVPDQLFFKVSKRASGPLYCRFL